MEGAFVDEAVARPEVERLAGHQFGEWVLGTRCELHLSDAIVKDELCVGVFGDAVVVSRPDHGWAPPGVPTVLARLHWQQSDRSLDFDYVGPEGRRRRRITGDGPLEAEGDVLPFEAGLPAVDNPALPVLPAVQFKVRSLAWVWGFSTPESRLAPAKTSLFEVRLAPARAAEQGPLPVARSSSATTRTTRSISEPRRRISGSGRRTCATTLRPGGGTRSTSIARGSMIRQRSVG